MDSTSSTIGLLITIEKLYSPRPVFFLVGQEEINRVMVDAVYESIQSLRQKFPEGIDELVLILDSPGGDIHSSYLIIKLLRSACSQMTVVVPRWAKSAATLICLAADEIVMTDVAELGPLDPLVVVPGQRDLRPVLDDYLALEALRNDTINTFDMLMPLLLQRTGLGIQELIGPVSDFVAKIMAPVYRQVDPHTHGANMRALNISRDYASRVLARWGNYQPGPNVKYAFEEVPHQITLGYSCHGFVIDLLELQSLGLPVRAASCEEEQVLRPMIRLSQQFGFVGTLDDLRKMGDNKEETAATTECEEDSKEEDS